MNENQAKALKHISFSRMMLWFNSRKQFHKRYILEEKQFQSPAMTYGKRLDAIMSQEIAPSTPREVQAFQQAPDILKFHAQKKLHGMIECDGELYDMIGFVDFDDGDESIEQKSGKTPSCYDSGRAQLGFYDLIRIEGGVDEQYKGYIWWLPTVETPNGLDATGEVKKISVAWDDEFIDLQRRKVEVFIRGVLHAYQ